MKQSTIHHHVQNVYEFKPLQVLCEKFDKLTNTLKREEQSTDPCPWLVENNEKKFNTWRLMGET